MAAFCGLVLFAALPLEDARAMAVETGSFLGDGMADRAIGGLGFAPEVVIIRSTRPGTTAHIRTSSMTSGSKPVATNAAFAAQVITSLDANGFTVGTSINANSAGELSHWIAFGEVDGGFAVGSYVGDGALSAVDISNTSSSPDFQASYVVLVSEAATAALQAFEDGGPTYSPLFGFTGPLFLGGDISDLTPTGFAVSGGVRTNDNGVGYHYVAWRERPGTEIGTYVGDGAAGDLPVDLPFPPDFVSVSREACCVQSRKRFDTQGPDESFFYGVPVATTDAIKSFTASGFVVGDSQDVGTAQSHFYVAWQRVRPVPALSPAALALLTLAIAGVALYSGTRRA